MRGKAKVPMLSWGKDHWTTLAYVETRCVDYGGKLRRDHMRTDAQRHPLLLGNTQRRSKMPTKKYPTILRGGTLADHDDWDCLSDMEAAGLIQILDPKARIYWDIEPGTRGPLRRPNGAIGGAIEVRVRMAREGNHLVGLLRQHKTRGRGFASFDPALYTEEVAL